MLFHKPSFHNPFPSLLRLAQGALQHLPPELKAPIDDGIPHARGTERRTRVLGLARLALDVVRKVDGGEVAAGGALQHVFGLLEHLGLRRLDAPFGDHDRRDPDRAEQRERECGPAEADVGVADVDLDGVHAHFVDEGGDGASVAGG